MRPHLLSARLKTHPSPCFAGRGACPGATLPLNSHARLTSLIEALSTLCCFVLRDVQNREFVEVFVVVVHTYGPDKFSEKKTDGHPCL